MPLEFYLAGIILWVIPTLITATIAHHKGRSFYRWLLVGILFSPAGAILMALILSKRPSRQIMEKYAAMEDGEPAGFRPGENQPPA